MTAQLNPYLSFRGEAKAAMELYRDVFGGELSSNTFGEFNSADQQADPADADNIMHAQLTTPEGFCLMAADTPQAMEPSANGTISLSGDDAEALRGYWTKLSDGGNVLMPLEKQMWGDEFGMLVDRFGVSWMVNIAQAS
jgi:Uncharacterized protein conserved in bacteria